jgi:hypothetical protein
MIAPVIHWYFKQRYQDIQLMASRADDAQDAWFEYLLDKGKDTVYGESLGFKNIRTYDQWRQIVPVVSYEDLKPWIERTMAGEQGLLWPEEITWFAKSSGTTGNTAKFIPISYESLEDNHFKGTRDILTLFCAENPDSELFQGKALLIGGSHKINQLNARGYYGDLSAVLMNHMPVWANFKSTPDLNIALMDNWEEKVESMAQATIQEDVTSISGVPTWTLVLFKRILEITGKKHMHEVWPNLELFIHGGVSFTPYREQFKQLLPNPKMRYVETYNASEGFFGVQYSSASADMLLVSDHGVFYEFYPVNEGPEAAVPLKGVKPGVNYAVLITTTGGLWRYNLGDTIQFSSTRPYLFKISGRTKLYINAFGEELVIENADTAIAAAASEMRAVVEDYTAAPVYMTDTEPGHEWLIEFSVPPSDLEEFTRLLDEHLKSCNGDYAAKRQGDLAMKMPKIKAVPAGTFQQWLKQKGKLGGQHKVPRLCNDRKILDEVLQSLQQPA